MKKIITVSIMLILGITVLDYTNLPSSLMGLKMSNMNWDFYIGILNIVAVLVMYVITYKTLDQRAIKREKNKCEISVMLIKGCYKECQSYINFLNKETVEKYIVPKIDFNSTEHKITNNLQNAPFENENIIMDLVKDGQVSKNQIAGYFNVKQKFRQYVNIRITMYDAPHIYEPLQAELSHLIDVEVKKFSDL